jgi:hypothetical protein
LGKKKCQVILHKGCVTLWPCQPFTLKSTLEAKEELWKNSNISRCKNIPNLQNNPLKETKILQDIIITI